MKIHTLEITHELNLEFEGDLLFEGNNSWINGENNDRFHEIEVYRTTGGDYILYLKYVSRYWRGESDFYEAFHCNSLEDIQEHLHEYNCLEHLVGYPDRLDLASRPIKKILFNWKTLKTDCLRKLGFKRSVGRPTDGDNPKAKVNLTIDRQLKAIAKEKEINLSALLEAALKDRLAEE